METTRTTQDVSVRLPEGDLNLLQAMAERLGWEIKISDSQSGCEKATHGFVKDGVYYASDDEYIAMLRVKVKETQDEIDAMRAEIKAILKAS